MPSFLPCGTPNTAPRTRHPTRLSLSLPAVEIFDVPKAKATRLSDQPSMQRVQRWLTSDELDAATTCFSSIFKHAKPFLAVHVSVKIVPRARFGIAVAAFQIAA